MWCALANCYAKLHKPDEAIRAFERASQSHDAEGIASLELARLYAPRDRKHAAHHYHAHLAATDRGPGVRSEGVAEALRFLSGFAKDAGSLGVAAKYCSRLLEYGGAEEEWAKKQLREIRTLEQRAV